MHRSRLGMVMTASVLVTMVCGCAMLQGGPTDQELVESTIETMKAAMQAQDVEQIMAVYSEDFVDERGGKEELRQMIEYIIDEGYMDSIEIDTENAAAAVDGATAKYGPVDLLGDFGSMTFEYVLTKEADGVWRIIESTPSQ